MVQSALIFALGFLVAALLALLLAPVLWRRAQWLMRHRLEAVVPMTLDEVRADRDALRAEHAMAMRRLEVENEEVRRIDAEHLLEISRGQEALKARAAAIAARDARIGELDDEMQRLAAQVRRREKELAALEVSHRLASREVAAKHGRIASLTEVLSAAEARADAAERMVAARETTDAERADELTAARREAGTFRQREATLRAALTEARMELAAARDASTALEHAVTSERERAEGLARALAETDGMVRERLAELAASVVRTVGTLPDEPELPVGDIGARVMSATDAPAPGGDAAAGDPGPAVAEPTGEAPTGDEWMAEMDAAAAAELTEEERVRDANGADDPGAARPMPANDGAAPEGRVTAPAREGRSPSRP